jgi:hypothetical protein
MGVYDNKVILITEENQQQVIDFWDKIILYYHWNVYYQIGSYCGLIDHKFKCYNLEDVEKYNAEIIEINNKNNMKFRKKPVEIEAIQFTRLNWEEVYRFTNDTAFSLIIERRIGGECSCVIPTLEGNMLAHENDWIIKGVKGEFYPCKPDVFGLTYERI